MESSSFLTCGVLRNRMPFDRGKSARAEARGSGRNMEKRPNERRHGRVCFAVMPPLYFACNPTTATGGGRYLATRRSRCE